MDHSVLCWLTYTFTSDLLSGLAKIVDCFHSCYLLEDKLSSSTLFLCALLEVSVLWNLVSNAHVRSAIFVEVNVSNPMT